MDVRSIAKNQLDKLVAKLRSRRRLVAPVKRNDTLRFDEIGPQDQVVLDYRNTTRAPKAVFFPQVERMLRFARQLDNYAQTEMLDIDATPTVLLGIRPCDVRGFLLMDRVFISEKYVDPYYQARRANTVIISLACDQPRQTCFCHAVGSGPYDQSGADILMRDAGDAYLLEAISERGAELLAEMELTSADKTHVQMAAGVQARAEASLADMDPVAGIEDWAMSLFDDKVWAEVAEKCLACGACTYACPGCHCFNIEDKVLASGGERLRAWDGCMFPMFTQHASGHNPRPDQGARWRQRTLHKFAYLPQNAGMYGCMGCGRCIICCPVRLDIREVLRRVREAHAVKAQA